ncbi:MAG: hypothetical protein A2Y40_07785 [Candidatus Margulisbacteria bacterium GWF2_35_9]|nr:MAG: hypothetical protein A2Y40_07785 [Candidatus Margulisbacteria bacterium GWF2_35_9]
MKKILLCLSLIPLIWLINLLIIFPYSPEKLIYTSKNIQKADLVVVLGGESTRLDYGTTLILKQYSNKLFYTGGELSKKIVENIKKQGVSISYNAKSISTFTDVLNTREFIKDKNIKSIILVTSPYHSYRAYRIFKKVLPKIMLYSVPLPLEQSKFDVMEAKTKGSYSSKIYRLEQRKFIYYYFKYNWQLF